MSAEMIPLQGYERRTDQEMTQRSGDFLRQARTRRTVREFSPESVPDEVVANCLSTGMTAPSGANQQPWTFVWVQDAEIRRQIREAAEAEEREFYGGRAPEEWLDALQPFGTDDHKPFLEHAPVLVVVFAEAWKQIEDDRKKNYYVAESVGIATGFLIAAMHNAGLATLTHTPSPMKFLNSILGRPDNERPYVVLVAGHPADNCQVPAITKRSFDDVVVKR